MESRNGSDGFDFSSVYDEVKRNELISYATGDGRKVKVTFKKNNNAENVLIKTFEAEDTNSFETQRNGWQSILNNFKRYAETNN